MTTTDFEPHTSADTPRDAWIELTRQTLDLIDTAAAAARHVHDIDDLDAVIDTIVDAHQMAADLLVRDVHDRVTEVVDGSLMPTPQAIASMGELRISSLPPRLRGDGPCSRCGSIDFPVWVTDSDFWNAVVRSEPLPWMAHTATPAGDGLMCINCLVLLADERGHDVARWKLTPVLRPIISASEVR